MYLCICAGVTESEVRGCIAAGARTVDDVGDRCAAGTGCGSCLERIDTLLDERALMLAPMEPMELRRSA